MKINSRQQILGWVAALQTICENYPKLVTGDYYGGKDTTFTAISFLLDILKMLGVNDVILYKWLSKLLSYDENGVTKGILFAIDESIKAILLSYITGLYTCPVDPIIPDDFLSTPYLNHPSAKDYPVNTPGLKIPIKEIDIFNLLHNCPVSEKGSVFYFDSTEEEGYTLSTLYRSIDFNAFLWFVINKGNGRNDERCVWDNRAVYRLNFTNTSEGRAAKRMFVDTHCIDSPTKFVRGIGAKNEIIHCEFRESGYNPNSTPSNIDYKMYNYIQVWGVADRYYKEGLKLDNTNIGRLNKTIFQFNYDYIYSLKLFDSKTLVAQVLNSLIGLGGMLSGTLSIQTNLLMQKIEKTIERIIEYDESNYDIEEEGFFRFSDSEYSQIENDATIQYQKKYETKNETGDIVDLDTDAIVTYIKEIDSAKYEGNVEDGVFDALSGITNSIAGIDVNADLSYNKNLIFNLIKEIMIQITMQLLTPKVMLLFAINARFIDSTNEDGSVSITDGKHWESFFKNFPNLIIACTKKISSIVIQQLFDFVVGQLRPIINIAIKKLMLETVYYYKVLLEQLIETCATSYINLFYNNGDEALTIANVNYADIIPVQTKPPTT